MADKYQRLEDQITILLEDFSNSRFRFLQIERKLKESEEKIQETNNKQEETERQLSEMKAKLEESERKRAKTERKLKEHLDQCQGHTAGMVSPGEGTVMTKIIELEEKVQVITDEIAEAKKLKSIFRKSLLEKAQRAKEENHQLQQEAISPGSHASRLDRQVPFDYNDKDLQALGNIKLVALGARGIGQTSLCRRYMKGDFDSLQDLVITIGCNAFFEKIGSGRNKLTVLDPPGNERGVSIAATCCRGASAVILAFDLCKGETLQCLGPRYKDNLNEHCKDCLRVVVGTKLDLIQDDPSKREVTSEEGRKLSLEFNGHIHSSSLPHPPYFETSSKRNENVSQVFEYILRYLVSQQRMKPVTMKPKSDAKAKSANIAGKFFFIPKRK